jgi:nitrite reductase/ring-hydroxylating ferredoxin subunit
MDQLPRPRLEDTTIAPAPAAFAVRVSRVDEFRAGSSRLVRAGGHEIAVFNVNGEYLAIDNACPHHGAALVDGRVVGSSVLCPWHSWHVDLRTGKCFEAPYRPAARFAVEVREGDVWVMVPDAPHPCAPQPVDVPIRRGVL